MFLSSLKIAVQGWHVPSFVEALGWECGLTKAWSTAVLLEGGWQSLLVEDRYDQQMFLDRHADFELLMTRQKISQSSWISQVSALQLNDQTEWFWVVDRIKWADAENRWYFWIGSSIELNLMFNSNTKWFTSWKDPTCLINFNNHHCNHSSACELQVWQWVPVISTCS